MSNRVLVAIRTFFAEPNLGVEDRFFIELCFLSGSVALFLAIPANALLGLDPRLNLILGGFALAALGAGWLAHRGRFLKRTLALVFLATLDLLWFPNGGSKGSIGLDFVVVTLCMLMFMHGWQRLAVLALVPANVIALHLAEQAWPQLVHPYASERARMLDMVVGHLISLLLSGLMLWTLMRAFQRERERAVDFERRHSAELAESERKLALAFNASPDAITLARFSDGAYLLVNEGFCRLYGLDAEAVRGRSSVQLGIWDAASRERLLAELDQAGSVSNREVTLRDASGRELSCLLSAQVVTWAGERALLCNTRDISGLRAAERERARLQAEMERMQKLESLGRLVGGIAHDMNNVLSAIFAVIQTERSAHAGVPGLDRALGTMERAAERGRDLVKGLVGLSRRDLQAPAPVDLNDLLRQEAALLERTLLQRYQVVLDLEEGLAPVLGEAGPLGSAVMNLCVNAVDAMAENGTLTLRTRRAGNGWIELVVEDTGQGMPEDVLAKAVEPFYTTKPVGQGTGLGLSMVFSTARAHGGTFILRSRVGEGTEAILRLPTRPAARPAETPVDAPAQAPAREPAPAALDILMVDDDPLLRESVPAMLELRGHRVAAVDGGQAALARLGAGPLPGLVILDVNMPGMNGLTTLARLRERWPDLPVLLATGFLDEQAAGVVGRDPHARSLTKPFTLEEVQRVVTSLKAEASTGS